MFISRIGSSADHGEKSINLESPSIGWCNNKKVIRLKKTGVHDFSSNAKHDYVVDISLAELREVLKVVGGDLANVEPEAISKELSSCLREIIRIEKVCIGNIGENNKQEIR